MALTLQAIPLTKQGPFNNITDWTPFKTKLIEEFGSIDIFGRDINQLFNLLPCYESVQEVAKEISHKIKTLQANLEIMQDFHDKEDLHSVALTQPLVQNIMKSLPLEVRPSFNDQFSKFRDQCPGNVQPPARFLFLAKFVEKLEKNYQSNPYLYDLDLTHSNVGINVVRQEASKPKLQPPRSSDLQRNRPPRPCAMCTIMGFEDNHYSLSRSCSVGKLSSPEILKLIASVSHVPKPMKRTTSAWIPSSAAPQKRVPRAVRRKEFLYIGVPACTTTRPHLPPSPRSALTSQFPWWRPYFWATLP